MMPKSHWLLAQMASNVRSSAADSGGGWALAEGGMSSRVWGGKGAVGGSLPMRGWWRTCGEACSVHVGTRRYQRWSVICSRICFSHSVFCKECNRRNEGFNRYRCLT